MPTPARPSQRSFLLPVERALRHAGSALATHPIVPRAPPPPSIGVHARRRTLRPFGAHCAKLVRLAALTAVKGWSIPGMVYFWLQRLQAPRKGLPYRDALMLRWSCPLLCCLSLPPAHPAPPPESPHRTSVNLAQAYLHSLSPPIIHRDLKSQNLLITHDWSVKVADFGLAREYQRQTATMSRVGSVQWAAPEVLLGGDYSHKCDLWCVALHTMP